MLADARTVPSGELIECDVCIVGAGPVGVTLARELSASKLDVVVLERGPAERSGPPQDPGTISNVGLRYALADTRAFGIGGSSQEWLVNTPLGGGMGRLRELDDEDFERRDWIPHSGWPFSKDELRPFYRDARALFGPDLADIDDESLDEELIGGPFESAAGAVVPRAFTFGSSAVFAAEHRRQLENRESVLVLTHAVAASLVADGQRASSLRVLTDGPSFSVQANRFVLAAGALETARLLLNSPRAGGTAVGNEHDLVGRFFMEHPHYASGLLDCRDEELLSDTEHHGIHLREGAVVQKKYSLSRETERREGLQRVAFIFQPTARTARLGLLRFGDRGTEAIHRSIETRSVLRDQGLTRDTLVGLAKTLPAAPHVLRFEALKALSRGGARFGWDRYTQRFAFKIEAMAEQIPDAASRLRLTDRVDDLGLRVAELDWRLTEQDHRGLRRSQDLLAGALVQAGHSAPHSLLVDRRLIPGLIGGAHHMGTTRMHASPRQGVVDADGRVHGTTNLYVAGSAVFPTVGYANPVLTSLALALRLAEHLRSTLPTSISVE